MAGSHFKSNDSAPQRPQATPRAPQVPQVPQVSRGAQSQQQTGYSAQRTTAGAGSSWNDDNDLPEFAGTGTKESYHDFNLPYSASGARTSTTSDGLVRKRHKRGKRRRKVIGIAVVVVLLALIVGAGVSGVMLLRSAKSVKAQASSAVSLVKDVKTQVMAGEFSSLPASAQQIDDVCQSIKSETSSPLWTAASYLPVVGSDITAARTLVNSLATVSKDGLLPVAQELSQATPGKLFADKTINVSAVEAVVNALADSGEVFQTANDQVQAIGDTNISQITELVETAKHGFEAIDSAVEVSQKLAPVLPEMLGANGQTRSYLLVAENNVEIRARGGFGGSQGLITITDGKMEIGDFVSSISLDSADALTVTDEEQTLFNGFTQHMGSYSGDAFYTPDFPRASELVSQMWQKKYGQTVDGVVAMDPVFLQYLLGLVGGVTLPDGTAVDGTNAATVLMHDVYWNYAVSETDAIFASVAGAAFDKIMGNIGNADMAQLVQVFQKGCGEGRFIVWMNDTQEEDAIKDMGLAADLSTDTTGTPTLGVYVNNYSFSKIDWYLNLNTDVGVGTQNADGSMVYQVTTTLQNTLKSSEVSSLPDYVANSVYENGTITDRGNERLGVYLYAPAGGTISDVQISGSDLSLEQATHDGLDVQHGVVNLRADETCTITYTVTTSAQASGDELAVSTTPTCQAARDSSAQ